MRALALVAVVAASSTAAADELARARVGRGPAVVLLHSLGGDRTEWADETARLAKTHTVIAIDLPGHGESAAPARVDVAEVAEQVVAVLRAEKATPAVLIGHSMGGLVAAHVAASAPSLVRALVVVDMSIAPGLMPPEQLEALRTALAKDREAALRGFFGGLCSPGQYEALARTLRRVSSATVVGYLEAAMRAPIDDGGRALGMPVLLMRSKLLLTVPKPRAEAVAELGFGHVANLTVEDFPQAMHWIMWDEPRRFHQVLEQLLRRVERR
jgi:pimeloyl-ACP methyl ester carboxylesterase